MAKKTKAIKPSQIMGRPIEWTKELVEEKRLALEKWIDNPKNYYFTSFLTQERLHAQQIERFCQMSPEFCETYKNALLIQEQRLIDLAVTRKGDGNFIKFVLQNKAGWREKNEISGDSANPLAVIMDRIALSNQDQISYDE